MADTLQDFQHGKKTGQYIFYLIELKKINSRIRLQDITLYPSSRLFPRNCLLFKIIRENDGMTTVLSDFSAFCRLL
jgi:hypothetical protein